jgi:hypothetical protein
VLLHDTVSVRDGVSPPAGPQLGADGSVWFSGGNDRTGGGTAS